MSINRIEIVKLIGLSGVVALSVVIGQNFGKIDSSDPRLTKRSLKEQEKHSFEEHRYYEKSYPSLISVKISKKQTTQGEVVLTGDIHCRSEIQTLNYRWILPPPIAQGLGQLEDQSPCTPDQPISVELPLSVSLGSERIFLEAYYYDSTGAKIGGINSYFETAEQKSSKGLLLKVNSGASEGLKILY